VINWLHSKLPYQRIAQQKAAVAKVNLHWSLGYLEETQALQPASFDLIFNRICWYYCQNDKAFAKQLCGLLAPGGSLYIHAPNSQFHGDTLSTSAQWRTALNAGMGIKIGHPMLPPRRRAALPRCLLTCQSANWKRITVTRVTMLFGCGKQVTCHVHHKQGGKQQ